MKKAISLMLAFVLCLSLCACGKSEAVKNVEALIDAIGEVTAESGKTINAAESAYNALTEEEKAEVSGIEALSAAKVDYAEALIDSIGEVTIDSKSAILAAEEAYSALSDEEKMAVASTTTLTAAIDQLDILLKEQELIGRWCYISDKSAGLTFLEGGTVELGEGFKADYIFTDNGIMIDFEIEYDFTYENFEGITVLMNEYAGTYVREEDYDAVHNKVFVDVDLATVDISEYAEFVHLDYRLDDFGEKEPANTHLVVSEVYDQGLIYWGTTGGDVIVEYGGENTIHGGFPFGATSYVPEFGRMKGTIVFIRAEYVDEYIFNESERKIVSKLFGSSPASAPAGYGNYVEFPY